MEVKARNNIKYGYPEYFIDHKKQKHLCEAAEHYIIDTSWSHPIRFDIISILKHQDVIQITHIEDAFY